MFQKLGKKLKIAAVLALALVSVFVASLVVSADPAFISLQADRTSIDAGESVVFTVRTNSLTNYVFAAFDGLHVQGVLRDVLPTGHHDWTVTVAPARSTDVVIFASEVNFEPGAASMTVPITVNQVAGNPSQTAEVLLPPVLVGQLDVLPAAASPPLQTVPAMPFSATVPGLAIHSVAEVMASAENLVRLQIVTGPDVGFVWIRCDTPRYHLATRVQADATTITWLLEYRPQAMTPHVVQLSANRTYTRGGATNVELIVPVSVPFIPAPTPQIQSISVSPSHIVAGSSVTVRVRTNADVGAVWIRDTDGVERALVNVEPNTATQRNWEVVITPVRSGTITAYANTTREAPNPVGRNHQLHVVTQRASIVAAHATIHAWHWGWVGSAHALRVVTNEFANTVWATLPNGATFNLTRVSNIGTNRVWELRSWSGQLPITVHVTEHGSRVATGAVTTVVNTWSNVPGWGTPGWGWPAGWGTGFGWSWHHPSWGWGPGFDWVYRGSGWFFNIITEEWLSWGTFGSWWWHGDWVWIGGNKIQNIHTGEWRWWHGGTVQFARYHYWSGQWWRILPSGQWVIVSTPSAGWPWFTPCWWAPPVWDWSPVWVSWPSNWWWTQAGWWGWPTHVLSWPSSSFWGWPWWNLPSGGANVLVHCRSCGEVVFATEMIMHAHHPIHNPISSTHLCPRDIDNALPGTDRYYYVFCFGDWRASPPILPGWRYPCVCSRGLAPALEELDFDELIATLEIEIEIPTLCDLCLTNHAPPDEGKPDYYNCPLVYCEICEKSKRLAVPPNPCEPRGRSLQEPDEEDEYETVDDPEDDETIRTTDPDEDSDEYDNGEEPDDENGEEGVLYPVPDLDDEEEDETEDQGIVSLPGVLDDDTPDTPETPEPDETPQLPEETEIDENEAMRRQQGNRALTPIQRLPAELPDEETGEQEPPLLVPPLYIANPTHANLIDPDARMNPAVWIWCEDCEIWRRRPYECRQGTTRIRPLPTAVPERDRPTTQATPSVTAAPAAPIPPANEEDEPRQATVPAQPLPTQPARPLPTPVPTPIPAQPTPAPTPVPVQPLPQITPTPVPTQPQPAPTPAQPGARRYINNPTHADLINPNSVMNPSQWIWCRDCEIWRRRPYDCVGLAAPAPGRRQEQPIRPVHTPVPVQPIPQPVQTPAPAQPTPQPAQTPVPIQPTPQPAQTPVPVQPTPQPAHTPVPVQPIPQPVQTPAPARPVPQPVRTPAPARPVQTPVPVQPVPQPVQTPAQTQPAPPPTIAPSQTNPPGYDNIGFNLRDPHARVDRRIWIWCEDCGIWRRRPYTCQNIGELNQNWGRVLEELERNRRR